MRTIFKKKSSVSVTEKCHNELEVKYTKMLTREFCLGWIKMHLVKDAQNGALLFNNPALTYEKDSNEVYELRLDVIENEMGSGDSRSVACCLIIALDIEPSLKYELSEGNGACIFSYDNM